MTFKEYLPKAGIALLVYIVVCVNLLGGFMTAYQLAQTTNSISKLQIASDTFFSYMIRPITIINTMFANESIKTVYLTLCFVLLILFVYLSIRFISKTRKKYEYQGQEHGSSAWCKKGEEFKKLPDGSEILNRHEGFILSREHYLGTDPKKVKVNKNILVFGGSGTGKTTCYIKPNILQMLGSYVITDPKGELYRDTSKYMEKSGYEIKVLNLVDPEYSNRYNPLAHIREPADVDIIAHTIVEGGESGNVGKSTDPFWDNTAKMLLKACIYYVISVLPEEERNLSSCLNIVRAGGSDETLFDKLFIAELKPEHPGRKEYEGIRVGADKTKQSIAISLVAKLSHFDSPSIQGLTTSNDISFEDLGRKKIALYVISPDSHTTYNYILTIFYGQLLQRLYSEADRNGGALTQPVYILLDEFANIGKIPDFNQKLSTSRSRLVSMSIIVQSIDQLVDLYKDLHENIISNCDTQLFLGSQSIKTCEYVSKSLGQQTLSYQSRTKSRDNKDFYTQSYSYNEQKQARELMTIDELKRLPNDEEIILIRGLKPIKAQKAWYFKFHPLRNEIERYKIHNLSEMPKPEPVEIRTMNVEGHINECMEKAKRTLAQQNEQQPKEVTIDISKKDPQANIRKANMEDVEETESMIDLQSELEKKFDELFGTNSNDDKK